MKGRFVIAAPFSGAGKTTAVLALLRVLRDRGVDFCSFKVGPDFVDPWFHRQASGREAHNLDPWTLEGHLPALLSRYGAGRLAVIEGVMGLFDGLGDSEEYSTAAAALATKTPVILLVPAAGMSGSAAALMEGFARHNPSLNVAGVLLTRCSGERHAQLLTDLLNRGGWPVVGWLPHVPQAELGHRGIGLAADEGLEEKLALLGAAARKGIDWDALFALAASAPELSGSVPDFSLSRPVTLGRLTGLGFDGDYPAGLDAVAAGGARFLDVTLDAPLPEGLDGLWLRAAGVLADLTERPFEPFCRSLARFKGPVWAEGLGALLLARGGVLDGRDCRFSGRLDWTVKKIAGRRAFGYGTVEGPFPWRGHQLRDYEVEGTQNLNYRRASTGEVKPVGLADGTVWACLAHGHPYSQGDALRAFLKRVEQWKPTN